MGKIKAGYLPLYIKLYDDENPATRGPLEDYMHTLINMLESQGIVIPQDISLVGYDGIRMSQMMSPRLTTYRQDAASIAREVFGLLLDAVENPDLHIPRHITVPGMLIEGETVR